VSEFIMKVELIEEAGYKAAIHGLALSYGQSFEKTESVAKRLCFKDGGHNKFLESIVAWFMVTAPRYWWSQADTYRVSTKQSESTMHTAMKRKLTKNDFEPDGVTPSVLRDLNSLIAKKDLKKFKKRLPESFLQTREWAMSYKTIRNIISQRAGHKLPHWMMFILPILGQVQHPELLPSYSITGGSNPIPPISGKFVRIGSMVMINDVCWKVHRFCGGNTDKIVVLNQSGGPPYSMILSEEELVQTKLF